MKGLKEYIKKHGKHFTEELVKAALPLRWDITDVVSSAQKKVYYNVTGSTVGDMAYLANTVYMSEGWSKTKCIDFTTTIMGDYGVGRELAFSWFLDSLKGKKFDFTPYI